jgi:glycosyltransferase involved in cell wall biosynthesis
MKICVYAIALNESKHVERFCKSASGADYIVIADTGSEDDTVAIAEGCGAIVHTISVKPFRFDVARNASLALVPADVDVCVSLDLDEVLEPGWREEIERMWTLGVTRLRHRFDFTQGHIYEAMRIHARHGYIWKFPCHEFQVPDPRIVELLVTSPMVMISHKPDKEKSRGQYMDMLEMALRENPDCTRSQFYYARELFYYSRWADAIPEFDKYLSKPDATWNAERCYALRITGECYDSIADHKNAEIRFMRACAEYPTTRDPWLSLARHYHHRKMWSECFGAISRLFQIEERNYDYVALPNSWSHEPHDLAALSAWNMGLRSEAIYHGRKAVELSTDDPRLVENLKWYLGEKSILEAAE